MTSRQPAGDGTPLILFGAFDRHNFGDMLFPHIAASLIPGRHLMFAGLANRDLRGLGGHEVQGISQLAGKVDAASADLIHVGGEILTCTAWQAAVMLQSPEDACRTIPYFDTRPAERAEWARNMLGTRALAPYTLSRRSLPGLARVVHVGVGGAGLDRADANLRAEVLASLATADAVSVRDEQTRRHLAAAGIAARLIPDPAVMVAELFADRIAARARDGEVAQMQRVFPKGYIAAQFSADFGDDQSLHEIAIQLARVAERHGLGVVLFRAGAAPWHDDLDTLLRTAAFMGAGLIRVFESLDIWDICALISMSRGYCGSSLHGRIVAMAFALPRVNFRHPAATARTNKQAAFASTWDSAPLSANVDLCDLAGAMDTAMSGSALERLSSTRRLASLFRQEFMPLVENLA